MKVFLELRFVSLNSDQIRFGFLTTLNLIVQGMAMWNTHWHAYSTEHP